MKGFQRCVWALSFIIWRVLSIPIDGLEYNTTLDFPNGLLEKRAFDRTLRIMPLGASITFGLRSFDGNGYRKYLRDQLRYDGFQVDMVGLNPNGTMKDNDNEGWSGYHVVDVHNKFKLSGYLKPNVVLINVGTNDCRDNDDLTNIATRMQNLLNEIWSKSPRALILLSGLVPSRLSEGIDNCAKDVGNKYANLVTQNRNNGKRIRFVPMHDGFITTEDILPLPDGTHMTDLGNRKMARLWSNAINQAETSNLIQDPEDNDTVPGSTVCDKPYGSGNSGGLVETQRGSGEDDGNYRHVGTSMGYLLRWADVIPDQSDKAHFADIRGKSRDDFIWYKDPSAGLFEVWFHTSTIYAKDEEPFRTKVVRSFTITPPCPAENVRWGDVNGDRRDDLICLGENGAMHVTINNAVSNDEYGSTWTNIGKIRDPPANGQMDRVRFGDIDGDGRVDYCYIASNGDIQCWRNGGTGNYPTTPWEDMGIVFTGKGKGDIRGVRFVDINGDGRSDWLWIDDTGAVDTYINNRDMPKGSIKPNWRDAGRTHQGMQTAGARKNIHFARIGNSERKDYLWVQRQEDESTYQNYVLWWRNDGGGGTQLKGDGNYYCDMDGDGSDDYIWVSPTGRARIYGNIHDPPLWRDVGWVRDFNIARKQIRMADVDGDGKCDFIFLLDNNRQVWWSKNNYNGQTYSFSNPQAITALNNACTNPDGVGQFDTAVRFADINGDGKADLLCMDRDGRTTSFVSSGTGYRNMGQVKKTEGKDRANIRWVDINGDGRADFLWVDKWSGDASVWYNEGETPASGSSMTWRGAGPAYLGSARGPCLHYVHLRGNGRADMYEVNPVTNTARAWYAPPCSGGAGDDSPTPQDPGLPPLAVVDWPAMPRFIALGDSYSAGIGAGEAYSDPAGQSYDPNNQCYRTDMSYPIQVKGRSDVLRARAVNFFPCTGDLMENILTAPRKPGRQAQINYLTAIPANQFKLVMLSISGNDVGFGNLAKACLLGVISGCDGYIQAAQQKVADAGEPAQTFYNTLKQVYERILDHSTEPGTSLIVTGYTEFFNEYSSLCNTKKFVTGNAASRLLTQDLRATLNVITRRLNNKIKQAVQEIHNDFSTRTPRRNAFFYDINEQYVTHRFCDFDENGNQRTRWKGDAWIHSLWTKDINPDGTVVDFETNPQGAVDLRTVDTNNCASWASDEDEREALCGLAKFVQANPSISGPSDEDNNSNWIITARNPKQAFHPKSIGHHATALGLWEKWQSEWGRQAQ